MVAALEGGSVDDIPHALARLERASPALAAVLRRALEPDPARRFADCAEMGDALRHLPGTAPHPAGQRWLPVRALAVATLLAVLALALAYWKPSPPAPEPLEMEAEAVAAARAVFHEVNAGSGRMTRRYHPAGQSMAYLDRTGVRKLVTRTDAGAREAYFDAHGLRFAYERSGESVQRYYFTARGTLARHLAIAPSGTSTTADWPARARTLLTRAEQDATEAPHWPTHRCAACDSLP